MRDEEELVGLRKTSLVDYPGRPCAVLYFAGCNLACPFCHNPEIVRSEPSFLAECVPLGEALSIVIARSAKVGALCLSGGEPLLSEASAYAAARAKEAGLLVKVDSNGLEPDRIASLNADFWSIDIKGDASGYDACGYGPDAVRRLSKSLSIIRASRVPFEARLTLYPPFARRGGFERAIAVLKPGDALGLNRFENAKTLSPEASLVEPMSRAEAESYAEIARKAGIRVRLRSFM